MAKAIYTIVFEVRSNGVKVTVPALPGFSFEADDIIAAQVDAKVYLEAYLKMLRKIGKPIPSESELFRVESTLIQVNAPRTMRA